MSTLWKTQIAGPKALLEAAAEKAADPDNPTGLSVVFHEDRSGVWFVDIISDTPIDSDWLAQHLGLQGRTQVSITSMILPDQDWVAMSLEGLPPVEAGRFYLRGSHSPPAPEGFIDILIEAGQAFGTGHHGTTRGVLLALDDLIGRYQPETIVDIGTGTGALAIAWAKASGQAVLATDIDPVSVEVAGENASLNGVGPLIEPLLADGFDHPRLTQHPFDLIIANILAGPLITMAPEMVKTASATGRILLSGILDEQGDSVIAAYEGQGLTLARRAELDGWLTLEFSR